VNVRADPRCCLGGKYPADKFQCVIERGLETVAHTRKKIKNKKAMENNRPECAGKSIIQLIEEELDAVVERLYAYGPPRDLDENIREDGTLGEWVTEVESYNKDRGLAEGIGIALALLYNPYAPNLDAIRSQAVERWESRGGE
jgi:hypothetical protein